jgi:hypothetical protein
MARTPAVFPSLVLLMAAITKKKKEEAYPWKAGACSRHITNLKQSILETFNIYGPNTDRIVSISCHATQGGQAKYCFASLSLVLSCILRQWKYSLRASFKCDISPDFNSIDSIEVSGGT